MAVRRVLIYDSVVRPETTGGYCQRALERLGPASESSGHTATVKIVTSDGGTK